MPTLAVFTGSFDPPVRFHRRVAELLAARFDAVVVVPGGPRPGRKANGVSKPVHRATLADLTFQGLDKVTVDLSDLEKDQFTPHHELEKRYRADGAEVSFVVSAEFVRGGAAGKSIVQTEWANGTELWRHGRFVVLQEAGEPLDGADLPPQVMIVTVPPHLSGESVRMLLTQGDAASDHLVPAAEAYIARHGLYQDVPAPPRASVRFESPRIRLFVDEMNPRSVNMAARLRAFESPEPDVIVAVGGDGTMLRAIRKHWRDRLPFYGVNTGGQGFLLNGRESTPDWSADLTLYQLPLLWVRAEFLDGSKNEMLAFNDTWVERATGQTAWVKLSVNDEVRVAKLVGDGALVATAAGSSSYARAMGAAPVPLNTDVLVLVGSNVLKPAFWRPAMLPLDSEIEMETLDPIRRPLRGFIDGVEQEHLIRRLRIRVSRTAAAELAFVPAHDPVAKLAFVQFPVDDGL
ncbi:MAG TPA: NAD(+)/NADH kinase [Fimbriiglobus sp.]|jgi:NAD kinase